MRWTFGKKPYEYNPETMIPVLRCSICNGEQVAGFKDKATGKFTDVTLIKNSKELEAFMKLYHLTEITKEY